jgi:hypothetical protein
MRVAETVRATSRIWLLLAAVLLTVGLWAPPTLAAPAVIEPEDIVLTPDDLPPGFTPDPRYMISSTVPNAGPSQQVQYQREATPANVAAGPIVVGQIVLRLDGPLGAGDALAGVKASLMQKMSLSPSDEGPNDGGTFTLVRIDDDMKLVSVGFIKENMIIVTMTGGLPAVVTVDGTLQLAGITSARMDAAGGG